MKNRTELISLFTTLNKQLNKGNAKFKYAILKNIKILSPEIETLKNMEEQIYNIIKEYEEKRSIIIRQYGKQEGEIIKIDPNSENYEVALKELTELIENNKDKINENDIKTKEYYNFLNEETSFDFKLHKINPDDLPDNISSEDLGVLMALEILD